VVAPMVTRRGSWPSVLALALLALVAGPLAGFPVLTHIAYLLILLLLLCALYTALSLRLTRLEHRVATTRLYAGERLLEVYRLWTRAPWPVFSVYVAGRAGVARTGPYWVAALGPRGHEELTALATAAARGRYRVGAAVLAVSDPLGIVVRRRRYVASGEVVVWPQPRIVPDFAQAAARAGDLLPARRSWANMPVAGAVRPFAPGDPSTRIHWLSSVRHGFLMVKDSDQSAGQRLWVALDLVSPAHVGSGDESTVEYAVEAAAYVIELSYKEGLDVGLVVAAAEPLVAEARRGPAQRAHLRDLLAVARAGPGLSLVATLDEQRIVRPSDALVILTPDPSHDLQEAAARLRRLGCGVIVVLLDRAAFGGDAIPPSDVARLEEERVVVCTLTRDGA